MYLPARVVSTTEVVGGCAQPLRLPLERLTGIRTRRVAAPDEPAADIARAAVADCLARSRYAADDMDLLICASISNGEVGHHYCCDPATALRLKAAFGFRRAVAFDVSNGCAGVWTAILLAEAMIGAGLAERAMVVSGEAITDLMRTAQREISGYLDPQVSSLTVGDSGIAITLEPADEPGVGFERLDLYTLGAYSRYCVTTPSEREHGSYIMLTDALRLGARAIEHAGPHLAETLRAAGWSPGEVAHLVPHQTSETTLLDGFKRLNEGLDGGRFAAEQYRINLADRGNTATTTHFIAIRDGVDQGTVRSGDRAAFCITGSGLSIGTALYTFDNLPDRLQGMTAPGAQPARRRVAGIASPGPAQAGARVAGIGLIRGAEAAALDSVALCRHAGQRCLSHARWNAEDVEVVVHTGVYKTDFIPEPATAALAAGALALNASGPSFGGRRTLAFDLMAGHLGTLKACWVVDRAIRAGRYANALVLASDVENYAAQPERGVYGLEPAGAALLLARGGSGMRFERFHFRDFPEYAAGLTTAMHNPDGRPTLLVRRDPAFERQAACCLARTVREWLDEQALRLDDFDAFLAPAWPALVPHLVDELGLAEERLVTAGAGRELVGAGLAAGLQAFVDDGRARPDARLLVLAVGAGLQTGCAVMRW